MKVLREQWPLVLCLFLMAVMGLFWVSRSSLQDIEANLGIELLGTVVSVLLIDLVVTKYAERRESLRRRPILRTIANQLNVLMERSRDDFRHIGIDLDRDVKSSQELANSLDPALFNEKFAKLPNHYVSHFVEFASRSSWNRKHLRELFDIVRADLPPELASAILEIAAPDSWSWQPIAMSDEPVDRVWIEERQAILFQYVNSMRRLDKELKLLKREINS